MIDNCDLLFSMINDGKIRINDSYLFHSPPTPLAAGFNFDKIEGMLLGVAIGDSLGAGSEGLTGSKRQAKYGEIRDYLPGRRSHDQPFGFPTDDTQLTFWTLKQLIDDEGLVPDNLAKRFCKHHIIGIGSTVRTFIANYKDKHKPWYSAGQESLGNGALMRISPVLVPYIQNPHQSIYADAAIDTMITHNSYANTATCVGFIHILWQLLSMSKSPVPSWWAEIFCSTAKELEGNTSYSINNGSGYVGPLWQYVETVINDALNKGYSTLEACEQWGSGARLFETVPSILYILAKHSDDPEEAIVRAVNDTKDNDTIASIVGAAIGALHGVAGISGRWINKLTGRTRAGMDDSGEIFKLILSAKQKYYKQINMICL